MRFKGDPPPPQETTSPKTMAKTAVQAADSIKCSFAVGDIIPPIPCKPRGKPRKKKKSVRGTSGFYRFYQTTKPGRAIRSAALPQRRALYTRFMPSLLRLLEQNGPNCRYQAITLIMTPKSRF